MVETLTQLLGRNSYRTGIRELYHLIQSPTMMKQVGYNVLETVLLAMFPELDKVVMDIRSGTV